MFFVIMCLEVEHWPDEILHLLEMPPIISWIHFFKSPTEVNCIYNII